MSAVKWPYLAVGMGITAVLVAILGSGFGKDPHYIPLATVGKAAAPFTLQDLEGNTYSLEGMRGRPLVVNFWSTWCGPCKYEHPVLQNEPRNYPDVAFLGAIYSDEPENAKRYLARPRMGLPYPQLVDPNGRMALDYGVSGVPETYFINPDGIIVHKHVAPISPKTLAACIELARTTGEVDPQVVARCEETP